MKGLLIKDFRILMQQKRTLLIMVIMGAFFIMSRMNLEFVIGYLTVMASFMALGTISYDEADNGYAFLFTLPFTRKEYAIGKYVFSTVVSGIVWSFLNLLLAAASGGAYEAENALESICIFAAVLVMQAVMLPLQIKYGAEKARIVFFLIVGACAVLGVLYGQFSGLLPDFSGELDALNVFFTSLGMAGFAGAVLAVGIAVNLISLCISCKIMKYKQV